MSSACTAGEGRGGAEPPAPAAPQVAPHAHSPRFHSERTAVLLQSRSGTVPAQFQPSPTPHCPKNTPEQLASTQSLSEQPAPLSTVMLGPESTLSPAQTSHEQRPHCQPAALGPGQKGHGQRAVCRGARTSCRGSGAASPASLHPQLLRFATAGAMGLAHDPHHFPR